MNAFAAGDVKATFDYLRTPPTDDPSLPLCYYSEDRSKTTMRTVKVEMEIEDGRDDVGSYSLDVQGFALIEHHTATTDFEDHAKLFSEYPDESAALIRQLTGAIATIGLGVGVRFGRKRDNYVKASDDQVARHPHADFTDDTATGILDMAGDPELKYSRRAIYNVWRVFSPPPQDFPLAVCDARTALLADEAHAEALLDLPDLSEPFKSMTTVYRPNPGNRWVYFSDMTVNEALVFKAWDSDPSRPGRVPHSSFVNPLVQPDWPSRCSVESRVLAYFA